MKWQRKWKRHEIRRVEQGVKKHIMKAKFEEEEKKSKNTKTTKTNK